MVDFFTQNIIAAWSVFIIGAALVAVLSVTTSKSATALRDKAKLPEGVVAGILIGIITSVPELISGIMGVIEYATNPKYVDPGSAVFGDSIGSNMFCMFALAIVLIFCIKRFAKREVNQSNTITLIFVIMGSVFCLLAALFDNNGLIYEKSPLVWHGFNFFSILILLSYGVSVFFMIFSSRRVKAKAIVIKGSETQTVLPSDQRKRKSWFGNLNLPIIILLFCVFSVMLIICSMFMAFACEGIIHHYEMSEMFGRTILLGVATSLPELITIVSFAMDKEYNMAIDSTVGSCGFNFSILFFANIAYAVMYKGVESGQAMFALNKETITQLTLFLLEGIFLIGYFITNSQSIKQYLTKKQAISFNAVLLSFVSLTYIIYIIIGFTFGNTPTLLFV